jgi:hypothetical protein
VLLCNPPTQFDFPPISIVNAGDIGDRRHPNKTMQIAKFAKWPNERPESQFAA